MIFLERFGQPTVLGKHPEGALPQERAKLLDALEAVATDTGITIPNGMEISFLEAARSGVADYVKLCEYMDAAIAKITLGQTASTQGTPGRLGNDDLQGDVRADLIRADADLVCESFNETVVSWLTEYNFPGAKPPRVYRVTDPDEDLAQRAERDKTIFDMGFKPNVKYINDQYGGDWEEKAQPEPTNPEMPPAPPADKKPKDVAFAEGNLITPNLADRIDEKLQSVTNVWINRIRNVVMNAQNLEELRDDLVTLLPAMDLTEYASVMGEALRLAEVTGRSDLLDEVARGN